MAGKDVLTTRIGDVVKVEVLDASNPRGTLPNYGYVYVPDGAPETPYTWALASGASGESSTERAAINRAARAIREHARRHAPGRDAVLAGPETLSVGGFSVTVHMGDDGTPVVQVDGSGEVRVNVNDGAVFDQHTENGPERLDYARLNR